MFRRPGQRAGDGTNPTGYVVFNANGALFLVLTGEARKPAKISQERAELFATPIVYNGTYCAEGEVAWDVQQSVRKWPAADLAAVVWMSAFRRASTAVAI